MKNKEFSANSIDNPRWAEGQLETRMREMFGLHGAFHHTVQRPDFHNMIYGGLHETRGGAEAAKKQLIQREKQDMDGAEKNPTRRNRYRVSAAEWKNKSKIIHLKVGDRYSEWGARMKEYVHGKNDGTHGSKREVPR